MASIEDIIKKIKAVFPFYNKSDAYFKKLIGTDATDYQDAFNIILEDIKTSWQNLEIDWFVAYLNSKNILKNLSAMLNTLSQYKIKFDIAYLKNALEKYPNLDSALT